MWWIICGVIVTALGGLVAAAQPLQRFLARREITQAQASFRRQREILEARFFALASTLGKPRDVRWLDCQWHDRVTFARDRQSGLITAFASVNIHFEAIAGGDMEDVAAVGAMRDACAVFHYQQGTWGTGGRAVFNMDPTLALERFRDQYQPLDESAAPHPTTNTTTDAGR